MSSSRAGALAAWLEAMPGAVAKPGPAAGIVICKVMGKMFAILSTRGDAYLILKCDAHLAEILREQYVGIGHRSHLDRRFWISVTLGADVPGKEIRRLAALSYELVCAKLTRKQKVELADLSP